MAFCNDKEGMLPIGNIRGCCFSTVNRAAVRNSRLRQDGHSDPDRSRQSASQTSCRRKKKTAACGLGHGCLERSDEPQKVHLGMILVHSVELATEVVPGSSRFLTGGCTNSQFLNRNTTHIVNRSRGGPLTLTLQEVNLYPASRRTELVLPKHPARIPAFLWGLICPDQ